MKNHQTYDVKLPGLNVYETKCPIIYALDLIGQKWKLPILWYLFQKDVTRYNELKRSVKGITNMMLTKSLQELEGHGLVKRVQYATIPPKVEYSLTARGRSLIPALDALYAWGQEQLELKREDAILTKQRTGVTGEDGCGLW